MYIDSTDNITNSAYFGTLNVDTNEITVPNLKSTISYKNKHIFYNFYIFKDLLFSKYIDDSITSNLICNILYDSTVIYSNVTLYELE